MRFCSWISVYESYKDRFPVSEISHSSQHTYRIKKWSIVPDQLKTMKFKQYWTIGCCIRGRLPRFTRSLAGNRKTFGATNKINEGGGEREIAWKSSVFHRDTLGKIRVYSTLSTRHTATKNFLCNALSIEQTFLCERNKRFNAFNN